jgi:RNA polymerase sigma-70 factor (ECF subfamily)
MGDEVEVELQALAQRGMYDAAATHAIEAYGPELLGFLTNLMGSQSDATEVFSQAAEDMWRGLPTFGFRCSMRTWLYVIARHAAARFRRTPWHRAECQASQEALEAVVARTRTATLPWLKTDVKDRWRSLRDSLEPDDRTLLVLRVDRRMEWKEIARIVLGDASPDMATLTRESDRLKKRFQLLKEDLRRRARAAGLGDEAS